MIFNKQSSILCKQWKTLGLFSLFFFPQNAVIRSVVSHHLQKLLFGDFSVAVVVGERNHLLEKKKRHGRGRLLSVLSDLPWTICNEFTPIIPGWVLGATWQTCSSSSVRFSSSSSATRFRFSYESFPVQSSSNRWKTIVIFSSHFVLPC